MMDKKEVSSLTIDQQHFVEHLEQASQIVRSWPAWKRKVLGQVELPKDGCDESSSSSAQPTDCSSLDCR